MRLHELAKELDISSKELMEHLHEQGVKVTNPAASLDDDQVAAVRDEYGVTPPEPEPPAPEEAPEESDAATDSAPEPEAQPAVESEHAEPEEETEEEDGAEIVVKGPIIVKEFASMLDLKPNQLIADLMKRNVFASINEKIDFKLAQDIAASFGKTLIQEKKKERKPPPPKKETAPEPRPQDTPEQMMPRPPVVTFLGHVDHGKTSLLDHIRKTRVAAGESGGITQHIGAYSVEYNDHRITFLDTPGHAAFTAMRARGAQLTDIAVLVVASDDGIMPQTREAYQHAAAAGVCIIVAINKCDLPSANPDRVRQQLQEIGLAPEDWGGETGCVQVSAATGEGIDQLLDRILLETEMLELQANPGRPAEGYIIEAQMEPGMGPTATVLVRAGTLTVGDAMVCGSCWGRIKALVNDQGVKVRQAGPSAAVRCVGLNSVPEAGAEFTVYKDDKKARAIAGERQEEERKDSLNEPQRALTLENMFAEGPQEEKKTLNVVLKCDVQGTLEAVEQALAELPRDKVELNPVLTGIGNISANDVLLAKASQAIIIGFHVGKETGIDKSAKHHGVEIRLYSVIYELIDDIRNAMSGLLDPLFKENTLGRAEIRQIFDIGRTGKIAGCMAVSGRIRAKSRARLRRGSEIMYEGRITSLKRFQSDANEVREGQECGIGLDNFKDIEEGDIIESYEMQRIEQEI